MSKLNPYIVLDFETGGLDGSKNPITEIGMLCIDGKDLMEIGRFDSYIKPYIGYEYDKKALEFTGTTLEKLDREGRDLKEVMIEVANLMKEWHNKTSNTHTKKPILVGHNIQFDISFLQQCFKEAKLDISKYLDGKMDFHGKYYPHFIDTMTLSKLTFGGDDNFTSFKLGNCIQGAGQTLVDAHKAINDVVATKELLIYFVNKLRSDSVSVGEGSGKIRFREKFQLQI